MSGSSHHCQNGSSRNLFTSNSMTYLLLRTAVEKEDRPREFANIIVCHLKCVSGVNEAANLAGCSIQLKSAVGGIYFSAL